MCLSRLISDGFYTQHAAGELSSPSFNSRGFQSTTKHLQIAPQNCTGVRTMEKPGQCSKKPVFAKQPIQPIQSILRQKGRGGGRKEGEKAFRNRSNEACLITVTAGGKADFKCENIQRCIAHNCFHKVVVCGCVRACVCVCVGTHMQRTEIY